MFDLIKYDYVEMGLPNLQVQVRKDETNRPETFVCHKCFAPFAESAAKKYPQWRFVAPSFSRGADKMGFVSKFVVYEGKEELGIIGWDFNRSHDSVFTIQNERIRAKRQRGSQAKTKDVTKAVKTVGKMFGVKNLNERFQAVLSGAYHTVHTVKHDRERVFDRAYEGLTELLKDYLMRSWEQVCVVAKEQGADEKELAAMPGQYVEYMITKDIYEAYNKNQGAVVMITGSDYAVRTVDSKNHEVINIYSTDTLPPYIKTAVGLLKLVEDDHFIKDIGVKIDSSSFFVMQPQ